MLRKYFNHLFIAVLSTAILSLSSCGGTDPEPNTYKFDKMQDTTFLMSITQPSLKAFLSLNNLDYLSDEIKNDISIYKVTYETTYNGDEITASGLICYPKGLISAAPILSAQHGTIASDMKAPSSFNFFEKRFTLLEIFAANGYITFIPDYLGYNASGEIVHPYYNFENQSQAVADMIEAGQEFLLAKNIPFEKNLYLFGYSEGGYTTTATHKALENDPTFDLTIKANASGAGGYDINGVMDEIIQNDTYYAPALLAFVIHAYNQTLPDWKQPETDFFQEPYASKIPTLFDGSKTTAEINSELTSDLTELFNPEMLAAMRSGEENKVRLAFAANSVHDWVPVAPTRLYHSVEDNIIPFSNSEETYNTMLANGATNLSFVTIPQGDHGQAALVMIPDVFTWFREIQSEAAVQ